MIECICIYPNFCRNNWIAGCLRSSLGFIRREGKKNAYQVSIYITVYWCTCMCLREQRVRITPSRWGSACVCVGVYTCRSCIGGCSCAFSLLLLSSLSFLDYLKSSHVTRREHPPQRTRC
jgi:hypothetical protein